jgi:hypothetical protein
MDQFPQSNYQSNGSGENVMGLKDWLLVLIVQMIPCVGIIMMFVWAFGNDGNQTRKNYCRAMLIIAAVMFVLAIITYATIYSAIMQLLLAM